MNHYWILLKRSRLLYAVVLSFVTTIVIVNAVFDFAERIISTPFFLFPSLALFFFLFSVAIRWRLWDEHEA